MLSRLFNNPWFVGALAVFAGVYLLRNTLLPLLQSETVASSYGLEDLQVDFYSEPSPASFNQVDMQALSWRLEASRDPFREIGLSADKQLSSNTRIVPPQLKFSRAALQLSSIVIGEKTRLAVINQQVLSIGDRVGAYRVQGIERKRVVLTGLEDSEPLLLSMD